MRILRIKCSISCVLKQTLCSTCVIVGLLMFNNLMNGEISYLLRFSYSMNNLNNIVKEIELNGYTSAHILNNVGERYVVSIDPSDTLCNSISCEMFDIVFIVKSSIGNFEQRNAIRKTWGTSDKIRLKTLFVVGYIDGLQEYIENESYTYNDIIQFNVLDNYENLVYKTILSLFWLVNNRISTQYVHFVDDDRMVNTMNLFQFAVNNIKPTQIMMIGHKLSFRRPFRDRSSKYYISTAEYPYDFWPPYLIGGTILTNMKVVKKLALAIPYVNIIHMEDAFIGILSALLEINIVHNSGFLPYFSSGIELKDKLSCPDYKSKDLMVTNWNVISSNGFHWRR